jgi:preprotein translocase SecF subunit
MDFYGHRKVFFTISSILVAITLIGLLVLGVNLDIQFKGGAMITYSYSGDLDRAEFQSTINSVLNMDSTIQESTDINTGLKNFVVSIPSGGNIKAETQIELNNALKSKFPDNNIEASSINVVNPSIGSEFLAKCLVAVSFASILMIIYISFRFRRISGWSAGLTAVVALIHDLLMAFAVFVFFNFPINANFIAVCLTILGYSLTTPSLFTTVSGRTNGLQRTCRLKSWSI